MGELISYETIRSVHRNEKGSEALAKLPEGFFDAVRAWILRKQGSSNPDSIIELNNAKFLLEDIINRRGRKIVTAALRTMRGELPPQNMAVEEQKFFDNIIAILKEYTNEMKFKMFDYSGVVEQKLEEAKKEMSKIEEQKPSVKCEKEEVINKDNSPSSLLIPVTFLSDMQAFVDENGKIYGPYKSGENAEIPQQIAKILIKRKIAKG